jgi:hypothetical protein
LPLGCTRIWASGSRILSSCEFSDFNGNLHPLDLSLNKIEDLKFLLIKSLTNFMLVGYRTFDVEKMFGEGE